MKTSRAPGIPGALDVEAVNTKSEAIFIWAALGTIFRELAPPSIGLDPIKPCTLIFPMGFGALIQIGWINTVHKKSCKHLQIFLSKWCER